MSGLLLGGCGGVLGTPTARFSGSPLSGAAPLSVQLDDESCGNYATSWLWEKCPPGLSFDGITSRVNAGDSATLNPAAVTYSCWVKFTDFVPAYIQVIGREGGASPYCNLLVKSNGKLACYVSTDSGGSNYDGSGSHTLLAGAWRHLAMTYVGSAGVIGYVDGEADGSGLTSDGIAVNTGDTVFGASLVWDRPFHGLMRDVRIYSRALSAGEVATLAAGGDVSSGLVGRWPMTDAQGLVAEDVAGDNDGALEGTTPPSWPWEDFAGDPTDENPLESFAAGTWAVRLTSSNAAGSTTKTSPSFLVAS